MHSILWLIVGCLTICSPVVSVAASSQSLRGSIVGPAHQDYSKQKPVVPASVTSKLPTVEIPFVEVKRLGCPDEPGNDTAERFYADTFAGRVSVRDGSVTYYLRDATVTESLVNASKSSVTGSGKTGARVSSFLGSDKSKWQRSMATYQSVSFGEVYPHIRLDLKAHGNNVEKVFTVREGGKPEAIAINVKGAKGLQLNARGELEILTASGPVTMSSPVAYQEIGGKRVSVDCKYQLVSLDSRLCGNDTKQKSVGSALSTQDTGLFNQDSGLIYSFNLGSYDTSYPLIIDLLLASTYIGGRYEDTPKDIAVDDEGNIYIAGHTTSYGLFRGFPVTVGAFDSRQNNRNSNIFVAKFNPTLTRLLASAVFGGKYTDECWGMALSKDGRVYVTGYSASPDYPVTEDAFKDDFFWGEENNQDVIVTCLDSTLSQLIGSTYLGGDYTDAGLAVIVSQDESVYVTGHAASENFPVTENAYDQTYNQQGSEIYGDVFLARFDADLTTLLGSTYLGGGADELAWDIALDQEGNVYVTGFSESSSYPITKEAYQKSQKGNDDGFVSKLNAELSQLLASTLVGGGYFDTPYGIEVDKDNNVFIAGWTHSFDYPTTDGAYNAAFTGNADAFISKFDEALSTLIASTYLGGTTSDELYGMTLDDEGNVYVTGYTYSRDFPTTEGAYDDLSGKNPDDGVTYNFISKSDNNLSALLASTYIGGNTYEDAEAIAVDGEGNVVITGQTASEDYPTIWPSYRPVYMYRYWEGLIGILFPVQFNSRTGYVSKFDGELSE